ncbi:MAG: hypothetical protein M3R57_07660 [Chloroflexota bacterium]|nr:hypothetical protein [Chloroflexota bacterium]
MGAISLALWGAGIALIVLGYTRVRRPWSRYQALKEQDANVSRYEAWRGGVRDRGTTGASVAIDMARREARLWGLVAIVGFVLIFAGFAIR